MRSAVDVRTGKVADIHRLLRIMGRCRLPDAPVDNNYLENQIRPFAIGRRSWLFAETQQGARASANLYSLVRCAEVNGLQPYAYLLHLLEELPKASTTEDLEMLLPWNVKPLLKDPRTERLRYEGHSRTVG